MKKCPCCNSDIKISLNIFKNDIRKHIVKCHNCGKLLRKKISIVLILELILFAFVCANFKTHIFFSIATIINALAIIITYCKLPYVPYEKY